MSCCCNFPFPGAKYFTSICYSIDGYLQWFTDATYDEARGALSHDGQYYEISTNGTTVYYAVINPLGGYLVAPTALPITLDTGHDTFFIQEVRPSDAGVIALIKSWDPSDGTPDFTFKWIKVESGLIWETPYAVGSPLFGGTTLPSWWAQEDYIFVGYNITGGTLVNVYDSGTLINSITNASITGKPVNSNITTFVAGGSDYLYFIGRATLASGDNRIFITDLNGNYVTHSAVNYYGNFDFSRHNQGPFNDIRGPVNVMVAKSFLVSVPYILTIDGTTISEFGPLNFLPDLGAQSIVQRGGKYLYSDSASGSIKSRSTISSVDWSVANRHSVYDDYFFGHDYVTTGLNYYLKCFRTSDGIEQWKVHSNIGGGTVFNTVVDNWRIYRISDKIMYTRNRSLLSKIGTEPA